MDKETFSRPVIGRPDVLRKLNAESLLAIERGLLGDLPEKLRPPQIVPPRARPQNLALSKQPSSTLLSSCLPIVPDSPGSEPGKLNSKEDEVSPLKKTFSFRDKLSRMNFFGREKSPKSKKPPTEEDYKNPTGTESFGVKPEQEKKGKRLWFFKHKDGDKIKSPSSEKKYVVSNKRPIYKRSKSFEFLPRAAEDEDCISTIVDKEKHRSYTKNRLSYFFGSNESLNTVWLASESYEDFQKYKNQNMPKTESFKYLENAKEQGPGSTASSKSHTSSASTAVTSNNSGVLDHLLRTDSVQNLFYEFDKAIEMFSENYLSDCEPYTKDTKVKFDLPGRENRKSRSFSTLPSPKIVHVKSTNVSELSEKFSAELNKMILEIHKKKSVSMCETPRSARRGSVTDWCVLEEPPAQAHPQAHLQDKYRRAQKKPMNRVRRISSTKYQVLAPTPAPPATDLHNNDDWITPQECSVFGAEPRPPLVIPRISHHRTRALRPHQPFNYTQESPHELRAAKPRQYGLREWSPQLQRSCGPGDSPVFTPSSKRLGGSTENLLVANARRPSHLPLPASSSDSLDVDVRERGVGGNRNRKSRSMVVAAKQRIRSPIPAPRMLLRAEPVEAPVHEGPVKRTKFSENGKRVRKHWTDCYMVLTHTALKCYKDQKTYEASKSLRSGGTPPSPTAPRVELELPLKNAHVDVCNHQHTSRFARSIVLLVGYTHYLIQDETKGGAMKWLQLIQNIIFELGPLTKPPEHSPYQSSNTDLESLGRTPPAARNPSRVKQKAGGSSNEDLSDSTEVSYVKSKLRKFFARRPAVQVLVDKGIYKDEPVFGKNLDEVCPATPPRVPKFVVKCIEEIEKSEENMCTDGLYRASGNLSQVQKIRLEIDQNNMSVIENSPDIHVLTGSLKLFFRELKEPLIPCKFFDRVLAACSIKPREARTKEFREIVRALPACNRDTLKFLLEHLLRVTTYSEKNRMHTANLAIVFGPTLLWAPAEQAHNIALDCIQQNNVVDILLTDFKEIFAEDTGKNKKKA